MTLLLLLPWFAVLGASRSSHALWLYFLSFSRKFFCKRCFNNFRTLFLLFQLLVLTFQGLVLTFRGLVLTFQALLLTFQALVLTFQGLLPFTISTPLFFDM